jgi:hypothetical protein
MLGRYLSELVFRTRLVDERPLSGPLQLKKWQEQAWQLAVHASFSVFELVILSDEEWWMKPETSWVPHPFEQRGKFRTDLQVFYVAQLAVWIYTCIVHRFVDERRKDYFVMYLHHIVTIALVGLSWAVGYMRIGLLVLFVHDTSDIFVDLLKMVNYLKLENRKGFFASEIAYVLCVLSWIYFRLYEYPFRVLYGSLTVPYTLLLRTPRKSYGFLGLEFFPSDLPWHFHLNVMLLVLLLLHIYWFHLFLMIGYRILTESAREASRQEYEGDSDDEDAPEGTAKGGKARGGSGSGSADSSEKAVTARRRSVPGSDVPASPAAAAASGKQGAADGDNRGSGGGKRRARREG